MGSTTARSGLKAGLYIDVSNLTQNGGFGMRFDVLREFACREYAESIRLNAYVSFDETRAREDNGYRHRQFGFHDKLRDYGYKVIVKPVKRYTDDNGEVAKKSNVDLDLAVDALLQSENLDRVVLATGDGDFVQVVRALQNGGCRVEVVAFENVSGELRREADLFTSGYLIPELLPIKNLGRGAPAWGEIGSRVRGYCYIRDPQERPFGFLRYLRSIRGDIFQIDARHQESPYGSIFCHDSEISNKLHPATDLPSHDIILEFTIVEDGERKRLQAAEVEWINARMDQ